MISNGYNFCIFVMDKKLFIIPYPAILASISQLCAQFIGNLIIILLTSQSQTELGSYLLQYRPDWRPGAIIKALTRKYDQTRDTADVPKRKRDRKQALLKQARIRVRKEVQKPALVVKKIDGEYTVQMEVVKEYSHERLPYQYPYDDKPPVAFYIGRTAEENEKRRQRKQKHERKEQKKHKRFIESTFRDMCEEICMKTYKQAIGILPSPDPENPECPCFPKVPDILSLGAESCSCHNSISNGTSTETDGDDWVIEFTPPISKYNPKAKRPQHKINEESQYNYLDFRVKVLDKSGNQVPRFFTGPDGKQICSDLGGFRDANGVWLVIGRDGYIGPDNRWVPNKFIGPDGTLMNSADGKFTDPSTGKTYRIGVDGYIGRDNKWIFYPPVPKTTKLGKKQSKQSQISEASLWTCFGNITPSQLVLSNFVPHGKDRTKLKIRLEERVRMTGSTDLKMPTGKVVPQFRRQIDNSKAKDLKSKKKAFVSFKAGKQTKKGFDNRGNPEISGRGRTTSAITIDRGRPSTSKSGIQNQRKLPISKPGREESSIFPKPTTAGRKNINIAPGKTGRANVSTLNVASKTKDVKKGVASSLLELRLSRGRTMATGSAAERGPSSPPRIQKQGETSSKKVKRRNSSPDIMQTAKSTKTTDSKATGPSRAGTAGPDEATSGESTRRQEALRILRDPRSLGNKKVCKLARMMAEGHKNLSGGHKECMGLGSKTADGCCTEYGGICMNIFKEAHA